LRPRRFSDDFTAMSVAPLRSSARRNSGSISKEPPPNDLSAALQLQTAISSS
jgi:hypothetical protein